MKKIIIISIAILSVLIVIFFGWYLFLRDTEVPVGETIRNILPFGSPGNNVVPTSDQPSVFDNNQEQLFGADQFGNPSADLFRLAATPVAGAVIFQREEETVVRYVDRATGHIYDINLPQETNLITLKKIKVSNNTRPKIYEAHFRSDGNAVLLRSLKDDSDVIENLSLELTPPQGTSTETTYSVSSTLLRGDMGAVTVGSGNNLYYVLKDTSTIVSSEFNSASTRNIISTSFAGWRLASAGNNLIMYTKASAVAPGFAYRLNPSNGAFTKLLGPLNGLVIIPSPSGNRILYSYVENNKTKLVAKNLADKVLSEISLPTLAEKCIWSAQNTGTIYCGVPSQEISGMEPDNWYRGATHFSDKIWLFDTDENIAKVLVEPEERLNINIDVLDPQISPNEDYLIFINKTDLSLWAFRLE